MHKKHWGIPMSGPAIKPRNRQARTLPLSTKQSFGVTSPGFGAKHNSRNIIMSSYCIAN
jgi:hypothetical protein